MVFEQSGYLAPTRQSDVAPRWPSRTVVCGETLDLYKFRSMVLMGKPPEPVEDEENRRITDIGRPLRRTQIDEIP